MKTSLKKLLVHHHHKHDRKATKIQPLAQLDELSTASQDMNYMRDCYDSMLSAAAATANSAYEFSESLQEMGVCLLQKVPLNDDEETGKVMLMLGKAQFELQRLFDSYRSHISQTITDPSESLIKELYIVEEMKNQCEEKRELYEYMRTKYKERGSSKSWKGESFSFEQLKAAKDEFDEEATLFVFRLKSLKQGQSRSLLTQAARHHSAQLSFLRKAVKVLEAVEPHVNSVTQSQHIDYEFIGFEDDDLEDGEEDNDDDDDDSYTSSAEDDGELSFDYRRNDKWHNHFSSSKNTMELDPDIMFLSGPKGVNAKENMKAKNEDSVMKERKVLSQSAPLFHLQKFDPAERIRQLRPSSTRKNHSYALPKPGDTRSSTSAEFSGPQTKSTNSSPQQTQNLYHSYPLEPTKYEDPVGTENSQKPALKESNSNRMLPPLAETTSSQQLNPHTNFSVKKPKLLSFSGPLTPLTSKPLSRRPSFSSTNPFIPTKIPPFASGPILRSPIQQSPTSPTAFPSTPPTLTSSSPKISELHELPRPPAHLNNNNNSSKRPSGFVGFSAPLVARSPENSATTKVSVSNNASPLPTPPLLGNTSPSNSEKVEDILSPPLMPVVVISHLT